MYEAETDQKETAELRDYFRVAKERAWVIALSLGIIVVATVVLSLNATPQYRSSARLLFQDSNLDQALFGAQIFTNPNQDREVQTGATLVKLEPVADAARTRLKTEMTADELLNTVEVKPETNTNVIDIEAESTDPGMAASIANAFAEEFILFRQTTDRATVASARELVKEQLDTLSPADAQSDYGLMLKEKYESLRILESMQNGGFTIVQQADAATTPFSPRPVRNAILAVVVGLVVGFGLAFLLDYLDKRIKDEKTMEREFGVPVLAGVPTVGGRWGNGHKSGQRSTNAVGFVNHPALLESFRTLRSSLQYFDVDKRTHRLLITSALPQEGKTVTAANLGLSLAMSGKRVIILEADLRRPLIHDYLGIDKNVGLSNVLAGSRKLGEALQLVKADQFVPSAGRKGHGEQDAVLMQRNFYVLASGPLPPNPAELLGSTKMANLIDELSEMCDYLLIDTPPLLLVSDALALAPHVDAAIVAARLNATTRDEAQEIRNIIGRAGVRVIGVVAGGTKPNHGYYRKRGYAYGYTAGPS